MSKVANIGDTAPWAVSCALAAAEPSRPARRALKPPRLPGLAPAKIRWMVATT